MIEIDIKKNIAGFNMNFVLTLTGNRIVLFGPSGSGKSIFLKLLAGLCTPDQGRIVVNDRIIFDRKQGVQVPLHLRCFGYLPQNYTLFPNMTVEDNILYGLRASKIPFEQGTVETIARKFGIEAKLHSRPYDLSGGQQQRVALARIILIKPHVLLLDEPFSALDRQVRESLRDLVRDLSKNLQIPALLVTHDMEDALAFGQQIVIINAGSVLEYGKKEDILTKPVFVETARLFNFQVFPLANWNSAGFETPGGEHFVHGSANLKKAHYACIRPEDIMLLRDGESNSGHMENIVNGKVLSLHPRATYVNITFCSLKGEKYNIHASNHVVEAMNIHPGEKIRISLKKDLLILCQRQSG